MTNAKFKINDLVHINKTLPEYMSHFDCDQDAIIIEYSHNKCQAGNDWEHSYSLFIKDVGEVSWYHDSNLTLIKNDQSELLHKWQNERDEDRKQKSDLDWIFNNGKLVIKNMYGSSMVALAKCFTDKSLWGERGEGIAYYHNSIIVISNAMPYLEKGDKNGWILFCENIKKGKTK